MPGKYGPRKDFGKPADAWFRKLKSPQKEIAASLRKLVRSAAPGLEEAIKWGMPNYSKNGPVAGIMAAKAHVSLFFQNGAKLSDPGKLLQGSGKTMRALKIAEGTRIPSGAVKRWVREIVKANGRKSTSPPGRK